MYDSVMYLLNKIHLWPYKNCFRDFRKNSVNMIHLWKNNEKKITTSLISMFRGHKFREYDTFTEITWNIKSRKKFFIGLVMFLLYTLYTYSK